MVDVARAASRGEDLALARRAADGDREAQRAVFHAQRRGIHHALFRVLGSNRDLEDALQDSFVAIFRALPSFRGESSLARWCQTIAIRTAYATIRHRPPQAVELALIADPADVDVDVYRTVRLREGMRRLYAALDRIETGRRVAFALHVIDGRPLEEVADLMDSTRLAVKTRAWRARRELLARAGKDSLLAELLAEMRGVSR